jgi:hypothetical protein
MDRKERRRRARERKTLEGKLKKEASRANKNRQESPNGQELPRRQESPNHLKRMLKVVVRKGNSLDSHHAGRGKADFSQVMLILHPRNLRTRS